jgi:hypothetical protein
VLRWFNCFSGCSWLTHSSAPKVPRLRFIIELDRPATRDECIAIGDRMARDLQSEFGNAVDLDKCTFRPEQPVHVPPVGSPIFRLKGAPLTVPDLSTAVCTEASVTKSEGAVCTEASVSVQKASSVSSVLFCTAPGSDFACSTWVIPADTIPTEAGQRNDCLFRLARRAKGEFQNATQDELRTIVRNWYDLALPFIQTLDFSLSLGEFISAFERVKQPHGGIMKTIMANIDNTPLPAGIPKLGYGDAGNKLVRICAALQAHEGSKPFFLSARTAGDLLGIPFVDASRMLQALVIDGVIAMVTKGAGRTATRYRFVWPAASAVAA